mmetsp:Transcript_6733/g.15404  ORF Transcript_6733/g.15404 Transcript_6733/m.15404 type:complete len:866 (-) Transcript_6733:74-2671(-)
MGCRRTLNRWLALSIFCCAPTSAERASGRFLLEHLAVLEGWTSALRGHLQETPNNNNNNNAVAPAPAPTQTICGDNTIRSILQVDSKFDIHQVTVIRFQDALDHAAKYIQTQRAAQEGVVKKLKELEEKWYKTAKQGANVQFLADPDVQNLFKKAIVAAYNSTENALQHDCNTPQNMASGQSEPYEKAQDELKKEQAQILKDGKAFPVDYIHVQDLCIQSLGAKEATTTCGKLCNAFAAIALAPSDAALKNGGESVGQLVTDIEGTSKDLQKMIDEVHSCEASREGLISYKIRVEELTSQYNGASKSYREVQEHLNQVLHSSTEYDAFAKSKEKLLHELDGVMQHARDEMSHLKQQAEANKKEVENDKLLVDAVREQMEELKVVVKDAQSVNTAMADFKAALVLSMQSFIEVYNDTIKTPLNGFFAFSNKINDDLWPNVEDPRSPLWKDSLLAAGRLSADCKAVAKSTQRMCTDKNPQEGGLIPKEQLQAVCDEEPELMKDCEAELDGNAYIADIRERIVNEQKQLKAIVGNLKTELDRAQLTVDVPKKERDKSTEPDFLEGFQTIFPNSKLWQDYASKWVSGQQNAPEGVLSKAEKIFNTTVGQIESKSNISSAKFKEMNDKWEAAITTGTKLQANLTNISKILLAEESDRTALNKAVKEYSTKLENAKKEQAKYQQDLNKMQDSMNKLVKSLQEVFAGSKQKADGEFKEVTPLPTLPTAAPGGGASTPNANANANAAPNLNPETAQTTPTPEPSGQEKATTKAPGTTNEQEKATTAKAGEPVHDDPTPAHDASIPFTTPAPGTTNEQEKAAIKTGEPTHDTMPAHDDATGIPFTTPAPGTVLESKAPTIEIASTTPTPTAAKA